nr:MAG TPA: terminase large subunit [Caudoviricetes sp.]
MQVNIPKRAFNAAYLPLLSDDEHRYIVLYGGAGSGKSVFAAQRLVVRMMSKPLCNVLVVRKVGDTNRTSTFALLQQVINGWGLHSLFDVTDLKIVCRLTGNACIFKGLDDPEKIKSVTFPKGELTDIWIEEASEIAEADFNQLDIRLRGKRIHGQITLSFNPINVLHWLKKRFFDRKDERAVTLKTTYKDNAWLDEDYKRTLEGYKDSDPYYYQVYCLGQWGVIGKTIFDAAKVNGRLAELRGPVKRGYFAYSTRFDAVSNQVRIDDKSIRWVDADDGYISIYQDRREGVPYVIGGDTSGEGSDWFVGQVLDNTNGRQVCTLRHQFDEDVYAAQMYCLGIYYNKALIAIEANYSSYPIKELQRLRYPRQYVRQTEDNYTHRPRDSYGFKTTSVTRPVIIAGLVEVVRESVELLNDADTLGEMLTFVRNEKGRAEAEQGAHDDCVMALAIAYYARTQQSYTEDKPRGKRAKWTDDMYEDYYNADKSGQEYLLSKWGNPF